MSFLADLHVVRPVRLHPPGHHVLGHVYFPDFSRGSLVAAFLSVRMHAHIELTSRRAIGDVGIAAGPPMGRLLLGAENGPRRVLRGYVTREVNDVHTAEEGH